MKKYMTLIGSIVFALALGRGMAANWPASASTQGNLFQAKNNLYTTLTVNISSYTTTIVVADASSFPSTGYLTIENEAIYYTTRTATTFTGVTRGADGTTAIAHTRVNPTTNAWNYVGHRIVAAHHNVLVDEIVAMQDYFLTGSQLHISTSTGNVGVGTSAPGAKLDVQGGVSASTSSAYVFTSPANTSSGPRSASIAGSGNVVTANSNNAGIFAGSGNEIYNASVFVPSSNTVIIGGQDGDINNSSKNSGIFAGNSSEISCENCVSIAGANGSVSALGAGIFGGESLSVSGMYAAILGGGYSSVSGQYAAMLAGSGGNISGNYSVGIGAQNITVSGSNSIGMGFGVTVSTNNYFGANFSGGYYLGGGNVGVGTDYPTAKMDVVGGVKAETLTLTTGAGVGKIPVSDASGAMTLTDATTLTVATATYATNATTATWVINGGGGGSSSPQIIGHNDAALARVQVATATISGGYGVLTFMDEGLWPYAEVPRIIVSPVLASSGSAVICSAYAAKEYQSGFTCSTSGAVPISYMLIGPAPVITSTITLTPSGSGRSGYVPGVLGSELLNSGNTGGPFVFKVSHMGALNFQVNNTYVMGSTITIDYRKATSGSWTTLDTYSTDYEDYLSRDGDISAISGYVEVRVTYSDYNGGPADALISSFVFTPQ